MLKKILNKKEAMEYLGVSRYAIDTAIKSGSLRYKAVGNRMMFPLWVLDEWLKDTTKHIGFSNVATSTTHISHSLQRMENESNLASLREKFFPKKQRNFA